MNKTVWIAAYFAPNYKEVPYQARTGERGRFGGDRTETKYRTEQDGWSDCVIDGQRLQADTQAAIDMLNSEGYEVLSITAIQSGRHHEGIHREYAGGSSYGYGYGLTEGVLVLAKS